MSICVYFPGFIISTNSTKEIQNLVFVVVDVAVSKSVTLKPLKLLKGKKHVTEISKVQFTWL